MRSLIWICVLVGLVACQKSTTPGTAEPPGAGFDERQECTTDADCTAVEIECCDHCNGGTAVGVHRDSADAVRAEYAGADKCKDQMCTEMACSPAVPICRAQRCGVTLNGTEQMTPLPRP